MPLLRSVLTIVLAVAGAASASTQRQKPPVPDLTAGGEADDKHDWTLGPTGARGWIWGWNLETADARQILITEVAEGSPAEGNLEVGDVVLGVGAGPSTTTPASSSASPSATPNRRRARAAWISAAGGRGR